MGGTLCEKKGGRNLRKKEAIRFKSPQKAKKGKVARGALSVPQEGGLRRVCSVGGEGGRGISALGKKRYEKPGFPEQNVDRKPEGMYN